MTEHISELILTVLYNIGFSAVLFVVFFYYRSLRAKPGTAYSELDLTTWESLLKIAYIDDNELACHIKLEGYLYLNFIKSLGIFLMACTVLALLTLVPIYTHLELTTNTALSNLSIQNREAYSGYLLIPAICSLILAFGSFVLVYSYIILPTLHPTLFPSVNSKQEATLSTLAVQSCTIQFDSLGKEIPFIRVPDYIKSTIQDFTPERLSFIKSFPDYDSILKLYTKRTELFYKLEKIGIKDLNSACWPYYHNKKHQISQQLQEIELKLKQESELCENKNIGYGFIHCESAKAKAEILKCVKTDDFILKQAPADSDLIWENLSHPKGLSFFMRILSNLFFIFTFLVIFTPLTLSSLISQIFEDLTVDRTFVSQSLSSILLSYFQYLMVPFIIRLLTSREMHYLKSELATSRIFKYLLYSIVNIIIFPLIGSYTLTVLVKQMLNSEILEWNAYLSRNIEKVGDFFVNFILSMAFSSNLLDLLSLSSYIFGKVNKWQAATYNEEQKAMMAPEFDFPHEYSKILTVFAVTLVFSISTPIILPFGVLYMLLKYYVDKYNLLFVYQVNQVEVPTTQRTVVMSLLVISALFQSINSGLFIVSGDSVLIWLGGILSALSVFTLLVSGVLYKYWGLVQNYSLGEFFTIKNEFSLCYIHPCEKILSDC